MPADLLRHAHAHNDYQHPRPLLDALDRGFLSVEADVHLAGGELLVAHDLKDARPGRTLRRLYLDPLRERVRANGGRVHPSGPPLFLLIDVKSAADATYAALDRELADYADLLSVVRDGRFEAKAVTAVLSGNRVSPAALAKQAVRYVGLDGRLPDLDADHPAHLMPWVSGSWFPAFRWRGDGPMPAAERAKLREQAGKAHARGRLLRYWATPESEAVWAELRAAGVDLIGTDRLDRLRDFLRAR